MKHCTDPELVAEQVAEMEYQEKLRLSALLEAYRSLAYAANGLRLEAGSGKPYSQLAHLLIAYDTARATVASLDRCAPATTEQKAAAGKGGA